MKKYIIDEFEQLQFEGHAEGRAFLKYHEKIGGQPYGRWQDVPYVKDVVGMYVTCIKEGITWEELLVVEGFHSDTDDDLIY